MIKWIIFIISFTHVVQATKPSVPLEPQIKRATYIALAVSMNTCSYCTSDNQVKFKIVENFKGKITEDTISVTAPELSFDVGKKYILFLVKEKNGFHWISANCSRLIATEENLENVKNIVRIQRKKL